MRKLLLAVATAALILPGVASAQRVNCDELRAACERRDELGEQGEGNCRRYRQYCHREQPRQSPEQYCAALRDRCVNKDRFGEQGEGNCREYRQRCGNRY